MPELPDVALYCEALDRFVGGEVLRRVRLASLFVLRSVDPPISAVSGKRLLGTRRIGKRIVLELEDELFVVIHLMIAGRLRWSESAAKVPRKLGLAQEGAGRVRLRSRNGALHRGRNEEARLDLPGAG